LPSNIDEKLINAVVVKWRSENTKLHAPLCGFQYNDVAIAYLADSGDHLPVSKGGLTKIAAEDFGRSHRMPRYRMGSAEIGTSDYEPR
jgi:hypothetical protein